MGYKIQWDRAYIYCGYWSRDELPSEYWYFLLPGEDKEGGEQGEFREGKGGRPTVSGDEEWINFVSKNKWVVFWACSSLW